LVVAVNAPDAPSLRERIDFLLTDGRELTPAEIARHLRENPDNVRKAVRRMRQDGELASRGDGWYFATEATRHKLKTRTVRRGPAQRPVTDVVARHLEHLHKRGLRPTTIRQRRWVLSRLEVWLDGQGVKIVDATPELLERFCDFATGTSGRKVAVRNVSGFYRWAVEREDLVARNPARLLVLPRERPGLPRPISEEKLAHALAAAHEPIRTWLILAGWCGLRCMEIAAVHSNDVDLDGRMLIVRDGKGGTPRVQPIGAIVAEALEPHLGHGYLFRRVDPPPGPIGADRVQELGNKFLHRIGISETMHQLRHRYATHIYEQSGFDLLATQTLLGHRSIASTTVYARARPADQLHDVVGRLPVPS
jgi:integrase/recombinase XerC